MVISVGDTESLNASVPSAPTFRTAECSSSDVDSSYRPLVRRKNASTRFMKAARSPLSTPRRSSLTSVDFSDRATSTEMGQQQRDFRTGTSSSSHVPSSIVSSARSQSVHASPRPVIAKLAMLPTGADVNNASPIVYPPWSGTRANHDYPPKDKVVERQMNYQRMLDKQVDKKAEAHRLQCERQKEIDSSTSRSLATSTHEWGTEASYPSMEKAVYHELLATVEYKKHKDKSRKDAEHQDFLQWRTSHEQSAIEIYRSARLQEKQDKQELAAIWKSAAEEKRQREFQERQSNKDWEREAVSKLKEGMLPPRRMRKPPEEFVCGHVTQVQLRAQMAQ